MKSLSGFRQIVFMDFEFYQPDGERPSPICCVSRELGQGSSHRIWFDGNPQATPPYISGKDVLVCAHYSSAELSCHLALEWPLPLNVLDLYAEFRTSTNGRTLPCGSSLQGALTYYGLDSFSITQKNSMRELAMRGGPWTPSEKKELLEYCECDVVALEQLSLVMEPTLDMERALLRGQFMIAAARMESLGVPIDVDTLARLREYWDAIKHYVISEVDLAYGVFGGNSFSGVRFNHWLTSQGIAWPRLESGRLQLDDETFKEMASVHREISPLRELRRFLSQMRPPALAIGSDGRNRCLLSAFQSQTGRNQPSNDAGAPRDGRRQPSYPGWV